MQSLDEETRDTGIAEHIHETLLRISMVLSELGLRMFVIGARSLFIHGIDLGRETKDWDVAVDKPFTPELRDRITEALRMMGFKVQWRKLGFLVTDDMHVYINYAPLTFDEEFVAKSRAVAENILLPCVEDIVVLRLMSGERKDIDDVKKILQQMWHRIDKEYLYRRARQTGLEKELEKIVRRLDLR